MCFDKGYARNKLVPVDDVLGNFLDGVREVEGVPMTEPRRRVALVESYAVNFVSELERNRRIFDRNFC